MMAIPRSVPRQSRVEASAIGAGDGGRARTWATGSEALGPRGIGVIRSVSDERRLSAVRVLARTTPPDSVASPLHSLVRQGFTRRHPPNA